MKTFINDVGTAAYCGPTVVGAITGKPLSVVRDTIRASNEAIGHRTRTPEGKLLPIKGTSTSEITRAFHRLGYRMTKASNAVGSPTLAAWLRKRTPEQRKQTFVIVLGKRKPQWGRYGAGAWAGGHFVAVSGKKLVDTFTKGEWVWLKDAPHRRKRVSEVFVVERLPKA